MVFQQGKVYLVGAGVGPIAYLTIRGQQVLAQAEVLIYDALVDPALLTLVPKNCELINVGKRGGLPSCSQSEINQLLVTHALAGKPVVRLKSGDPFIFGRANPEIQALTDNHCAFEVIPGISSAIAAPLFAGIPLTDKDLSQCFAVLTGHDPESLNWSALSQIDTLVILMGGQTLPRILQLLLEQGRSPSTPIAIIKNGGRTNQQVWVGTLTDIVEKTDGVNLSPAVIVIGAVINLRTMPHSDIPLAGKTILITRSAEQSSHFADLLTAEGANVLEMPALVIQPPSSWQALDNAIADLSRFQWLILTSANGVEYFFQRLQTLGKDSRALAGIKIAVVGKKTAATLKQYGLQADFIPPNYVADSLIETFPEPLADQTILFPRVETGGRDVLVKQLTEQGANMVEVPAYQSGCPEGVSAEVWQALSHQTIDIITFASSKTVQNFYTLVQRQLQTNSPDPVLQLLEPVGLASIGPQTTRTCQQLFGRVTLEAEEYTLEGLTEAIKQWCAK
ncbi:MAG: uroporphyrinogen-III C-methyltransferase [Snowella sp.]|nr:uroporphyrinogen-III C-methyltransferase [Snowella sp.]